MFDRYTEAARRTIFFARYEASQFGSKFIEPEHLLLGLFREDKRLRQQLSEAAMEQIRRKIDAACPRAPYIDTAVELPLSHSAKRILHFAATQSELLHQHFVDCGHLLLGVLQEDAKSAEWLRPYGITLDKYRPIVARLKEAPEPDPAPSSESSAAVIAYDSLIRESIVRFNDFTEADWEHRLKRRAWTRKQAVGHLIDWATTHHQWFVRAMTRPNMAAAGYPEDEWVDVQRYAEWPWQEIAVTWGYVAGLVLRTIAQIPEEKLEVPCKIGINEPIPLSKLVYDYIEHSSDIIGQIVTRGHHA